jgi:hypothetical protein
VKEALLFLKKKKQKNFCFLACGTIGVTLQIGRSAEIKSLLLLFFRKEDSSLLN